jgi:hypothetical protein
MAKPTKVRATGPKRSSSSGRPAKTAKPAKGKKTSTKKTVTPFEQEVVAEASRRTRERAFRTEIETRMARTLDDMKIGPDQHDPARLREAFAAGDEFGHGIGYQSETSLKIFVHGPLLGIAESNPLVEVGADAARLALGVRLHEVLACAILVGQNVTPVAMAWIASVLLHVAETNKIPLLRRTSAQRAEPDPDAQPVPPPRREAALVATVAFALAKRGDDLGASDFVLLRLGQFDKPFFSDETREVVRRLPFVEQGRERAVAVALHAVYERLRERAEPLEPKPKSAAAVVLRLLRRANGAFVPEREIKAALVKARFAEGYRASSAVNSLRVDYRWGDLIEAAPRGSDAQGYRLRPA